MLSYVSKLCCTPPMTGMPCSSRRRHVATIGGAATTILGRARARVRARVRARGRVRVRARARVRVRVRVRGRVRVRVRVRFRVRVNLAQAGAALCRAQVVARRREGVPPGLPWLG